ncbi:MAG: inositol monophosphatase [Gemmatimonadota bacterium]|nr:inositol monophosphatase [Gemmatimonadota bacterium]MDQ3605478.1 inositol monophosphatase [Gemmatimonadota bacterium]
MIYAEELWVARRAAAEAAALLVGRSGAEEVREKARADLVTAVDEAAERAVLSRIRAHFPGDRIVAEESAREMVEEGRRWIVDPLDGTINYVHGHPFVCVSIAFADAEGPAVGVIHAPLLGEVYHAIRGRGAFRNDQPIRVSEIDDPSAALLATGFPFKTGKGDPESYFRLVTEFLHTTHGVRRAGSAALDLAYVASGRVEAFFEIGLSPWDIAAGMLLVTEAGGKVEGWPGDSRPPLVTGRLLASNGFLHPWLESVTTAYVPAL